MPSTHQRGAACRTSSAWGSPLLCCSAPSADLTCLAAGLLHSSPRTSPTQPPFPLLPCPAFSQHGGLPVAPDCTAASCVRLLQPCRTFLAASLCSTPSKLCCPLACSVSCTLLHLQFTHAHQIRFCATPSPALHCYNAGPAPLPCTTVRLPAALAADIHLMACLPCSPIYASSTGVLVW